MAPSNAKDIPESFEASLKALQRLVEQLEQGDVPLDELVAKFTEGHGLLKRCQEQLKAAELKIQQLRAEDKLPEPMEAPED